MEKNEEAALTKMRRSVEKLGSSIENYGDQTLMRFLKAKSMDPGKAAKMFSKWQKWRAEMAPLGYIPDSEVADELAAKKIYLQGLSKKGLPVTIMKCNKHVHSKDQVQNKKFIVYTLDKTIASSFKGREIGNEKYIGIFDLQNITYSNADTRGSITSVQVLQDYYPERLAICYILHMPQFFVPIWRFISRFLDKAIQEKEQNEGLRASSVQEQGRKSAYNHACLTCSAVWSGKSAKSEEIEGSNAYNHVCLACSAICANIQSQSCVD